MPTSTSLGLRPIPGPLPVPLPDHTVWLWLIPVVLLAGLAWWWRRPQVRSLSTPLEALQQAIEETEPVQVRFVAVDRLLREYLAWRVDGQWLTTASQELLPLWEALLAGKAHESSHLKAEHLHQWYLDLDETRFGQKLLTTEKFLAYCEKVKQLLAWVEERHEKQVSGTTLATERNKTASSDELVVSVRPGQ